MSDKVALVRLRAKNDQYDAAMKKSRDVTLELAGVDVGKVGDKLDAVGSKITRGVTLPVVAAGAASWKLASDFNQSFTQMQTLAGVSADEVDGLKESVKGLAGETAQSPRELAEALYFVRSSGVEGAAAMDTVEASAKGAAIGLGQAAQVADVTTSALNTYGSENLTAAQTVDMLAAAVAAGKGEAAAFAPQLGGLLPIAQKLGLGFDQVAGSVAFLTQTNGDVARSSTMVAGVFQKLQAPTEQGRKIFDEYGISLEEVQATLAEKGLIPALQMLDDKLGGNSQALRKVFDDVEGFNGVLGLLRNNGTDAQKVIDGVTNSTGYLGDAFAKVNETDEFKFKQAVADLQVAAIELGQQLIPIFTDIAEVVTGLVSVFSSLPQPVQSGAIALAGVLAVAGPTASILGNVANAANGLAKAWNADSLIMFKLGLQGVTSEGAGAANTLGGLVYAAGGLPVVFGAGATAIAGAALILYDFAAQAEQARQMASSLRDEAERTGKTIDQVFNEQLANTLAGVAGGLDGLGQDGSRVLLQTLDQMGVGAAELAKVLKGSAEEYKKFQTEVARKGGAAAVSELDNLRAAAGKAAEQQAKLTAAQEDLGVGGQNLEATTRQLIDTTMAMVAASKAGTDATNGQAYAQERLLQSANDQYASATAVADAEQARRDAIEGVAQAQRDEADAARGVSDAQESVADARRAVGDAMDAEADARRAVGDAMRAESDAARGVADAQADVVTATQDLADARREASGDSDAMRDAIDDIASAEERLAAAQRDSTEAQQALDDVRSNYQQTLTGLADNRTLDEIAVRDAQRRLDEARARAANPQEGDNAQELRDNITEAEIALRRARDQLAESTDTLNRNQANGVEGSDAYLQAQEDLTTAHDNEADAVQGVADAVSHREEVQAAADQAVSDAEATLAEKVQAVNDAQQRRLDAHQAVLDAQGKVAEAARGVRDAEAEVRDRLGEVAIAQQALVDAKQATLDARNEVAFATAAVGKAHFDATGNINDYADALEDALALMDPNDPHYQATMAFLQALRDISRNSLTGGAPLPSWLGGPRSGEKSGTSKITADQIAAATDTPALAAMHAIQSLNAEAAAQIAKGEKEYRQWLVAIAHLFGAAIDMAAINAMVAQAFPAAAPNVVGPAFNWGDEIAKFYANGGSTYGSAATGNYANPYHGAPPPLDPDRMARAIAESMPPPVHLAAQVDARGLNAHQATTLVGAELMDQIRAAGMR